MKLYRKIDENGLFIEDVLLDKIPYLTETITETITNEDETTEEIQAEKVVMRDILDEDNEVIGQEPVISPYYIETPCPEGFYHPKWNGEQWIEGGVADNSLLEFVKRNKVAESIELLEQFLLSHPLLYSDNNYYAVTLVKQNLLANQLLTYILEQQSGIVNPTLTWNATGDVCTEWTYEDLVGLSLSIKTYVKPYVALQQEYDKIINQCVSIKEIDNLVINYEII